MLFFFINNLYFAYIFIDNNIKFCVRKFTLISSKFYSKKCQGVYENQRF